MLSNEKHRASENVVDTNIDSVGAIINYNSLHIISLRFTLELLDYFINLLVLMIGTLILAVSRYR